MSVGTPTLTAGPAPQAAPRNVWIDNKTGAVYPWPINHETEDSLKTIGRRLTRSGPSRRLRLLAQPTHPGPARIVMHGTFLDREQAQYREFVTMFESCDDRTFTYIDASGDSYEIIAIQLDARRKMAADRADGSYFEYSLEVEIVEVLQGALKGHVA